MSKRVKRTLIIIFSLMAVLTIAIQIPMFCKISYSDGIKWVIVKVVIIILIIAGLSKAKTVD